MMPQSSIKDQRCDDVLLVRILRLSSISDLLRTMEMHLASPTHGEMQYVQEAMLQT